MPCRARREHVAHHHPEPERLRQLVPHGYRLKSGVRRYENQQMNHDVLADTIAKAMVRTLLIAWY
jgi:hypothetical protein